MHGMVVNASKMLDKRLYINLFVLVAYTAGYNFYLWELYFGNWYVINAKGFYYLVTIITLLSGVIDRNKAQNTTEASRQVGFITELAVIINFIFIVITLYDIIFTPLLYFFIYNGSVLVTTIIVTIASTRHGNFKK